jgi:hypothetical protein
LNSFSSPPQNSSFCSNVEGECCSNVVVKEEKTKGIRKKKAKEKKGIKKRKNKISEGVGRC